MGDKHVRIIKKENKEPEEHDKRNIRIQSVASNFKLRPNRRSEVTEEVSQ